jgi:hypothetical protein
MDMSQNMFSSIQVTHDGSCLSLQAHPMYNSTDIYPCIRLSMATKHVLPETTRWIFLSLQAHPMYNSTDIYNTCLFPLLLCNNNTGPPDAILYDFPLGWWDHDWAGCFDNRQPINDTHWWQLVSNTLAMHSRWATQLHAACCDSQSAQPQQVAA